MLGYIQNRLFAPSSLVSPGVSCHISCLDCCSILLTGLTASDLILLQTFPTEQSERSRWNLSNHISPLFRNFHGFRSCRDKAKVLTWLTHLASLSPLTASPPPPLLPCFSHSWLLLPQSPCNCYSLCLERMWKLLPHLFQVSAKTSPPEQGLLPSTGNAGSALPVTFPALFFPIAITAIWQTHV